MIKPLIMAQPYQFIVVPSFTEAPSQIKRGEGGVTSIGFNLMFNIRNANLLMDYRTLL